MIWSSPCVTGTVPCPRAGHSVSLYNGKLIFFGGGDGRRIFKDLFLFDPESLVFSQPTANGAAPAARCAHSATLWDDKLIIFGGGDGNRRFKDLYILSLG
jgi:Rab9 effector protein with kelch motifs